MECGKLTAKLRDAVPVCFMVDGKEVKRYKNIEIPTEIKKLPFEDFKFDVPDEGAITFKIHFAAGILPDEWPEARERRTRKPKMAGNEIPEETAGEMPEAEEEAPEMEPTEPDTEIPMDTESEPDAGMPEEAEAIPEDTEEDAEEAPVEATATEWAFNVSGDQRKALVQAIAEQLGETAKYMNAPSFAYTIGGYTVDKDGTLTGPENEELIEALAAQGFIAG